MNICNFVYKQCLEKNMTTDKEVLREKLEDYYASIFEKELIDEIVMSVFLELFLVMRFYLI